MTLYASSSTPRVRSLRRNLLLGCAFGVAALSVGTTERANAQAFNGSYNPVTGNVSRDISAGPGRETITIGNTSNGTNTAIINWTIDTPDPTYDFLPAGNIATFQGGAGFAVLNRILGPAGTSVEFNGRVVGQLQGTSTPGGTILFSSPGGIIVGPTGVFDVGNLVLTTLGVQTDENGYGPYFDPGNLTFLDQSAGGVVTLPGSQINAPGEGSYVLLVAPTIAHGGTTLVNGSTAYIAGRDVRVTINDGLFDIVVEYGTADPIAIQHSGRTGGAASGGAGDNHAIYMVTRGQEGAVEMLLGGSIGFDSAASASVENGEIVLAAGHNVTAGEIDEAPSSFFAQADITIESGTFSSDVTARANGNVVARANGASLSFSGDLSVIAAGDATVGAVSSGQLFVGGNLSLRSAPLPDPGPSEFARDGDFGPLALDVFGGTAELIADSGGSVEVAGNVTLDASAVGEFDFPGDSSAGFGDGGTVVAEASDGGTIAIGGNLNMLAFGQGAADGSLPTQGGEGRGGFVSVGVFGSGGGISVGGNLAIDASGTGSVSNDASSGLGALGQGGTVIISGSSGDVTVSGVTQIDARGRGGRRAGTSNDTAIGGNGDGGTVIISGSGGVVTLGASASVDVSGTGGEGPIGGAGRGGSVSVSEDVSIEAGGVPGSASVLAAGRGGEGTLGDGGQGRGGSIQLSTSAGEPTPEGLGVAASIDFNADGVGGEGAENGGAGQGGAIRLTSSAESGYVELGDVAASADGIGGVGRAGAGGAGTGGTVLASTELGYGAGSTATVTLGAIDFSADGTGGAGATAGGAGNGGSASIISQTGTLEFAGGSSLSAEGTGGAASAGAGGLGDGGFVTVRASGGSTASVVRTAGATLSADAQGGAGGGSGNGGAAIGGDVSLEVLAGSGRAELGNVVASADGAGGAGGDLGDGGAGTGGSIRALIVELGYGSAPPDAVLQFASLSASADGVGGAGGPGDFFTNNPDGGAGQGGRIFVEATNGAIQFVGAAPDVALSVDGTGGAAVIGNAGNGTGGEAYFRALTNGAITSSGGAVAVSAQGRGGDGGFRGNGTGGVLLAGADGGDMNLAGDIRLDASGEGGANGSNFGGGDGTGGLARLVAINGGELRFDEATVRSDGRGGNGTPGGTGSGGFSANPEQSIQTGAFLVAQNGTVIGNSAEVSAQGFGGTGDLSDGGDAFGGTAQIIALNGAGASVIDLGSATLNVSATAGAGATSYSGGNAVGGAGIVLAETLTGQLAIDNLIAVGDARGGDSGAAVDSLVGNGGDATGGFIQIGSASGFGSGTTAGSATFGTVQASANAIGGNGIANGSNGGDGRGGQLVLLARGGTLQTGDVTLATNGFGGSGGAAGAGGVGAGGLATAEFTPRFETADGVTATVGSLSLTSSGTGGAGGTAGASEYGRTFVLVRGSNATFGAIDMEAQGDTAPSDPDLAAPVFVGAEGAQINVTGTVEIDTPALTRLYANNGGALSVSGATDIATESGLLVEAVDGTLSLANAILNAGDGMAINAVNGNVSFGGPTVITATDGFDILASDGTVSFGGTTTVDGTAGSEIVLADGTVDIGGTFTLNMVEEITVNASGSGRITGGTLALNATGDVTVNHEGRAAGAQTIDVAAFRVDGQAFEASLGTAIRATDLVQLAVDGTALIDAPVTGANITIRSSDIEITGAGFVGGPGTTTTRLEIAEGGGQSVIGGDTQGPGYTLTQTEADRIRTGTLEIAAPVTGSGAARPADLVIRDLALAPASAASAGGVDRLEVEVGSSGQGGIAEVLGALALTNASAGGGIAIRAGERIQVITPTGSIRVRDAAGAPAGSITLASNNIWSASSALMERLIADPNFDGRNEALLVNDGSVEERGYIEAGDVSLASGGTIFVQNTGTEDEFAGITVVENTLTVTPTGSAPIDVFAFGRRINPDGTFVTNSLYFQEVAFDGRPGGYASGAKFNQCAIATGFCPGRVPEGIDLPEGAELVEAVEEGGEDALIPGVNTTLVDTTFAVEPLIEEPVTSGGDSALWDCEDNGEGQCGPVGGE